MNAYEWITTLAVPVTGIASWLAATRQRQNKTICEMQETVFKLVEENKNSSWINHDKDDIITPKEAVLRR